MKKKYEFSGKRFFMILLCLAFAINPSLGFCLPEGENVVSGQASFDRTQDNTLNINTPSENLIVNYDSFSIAQPEAVHFFQPSSSAIALNRVVGADPSAIYGLLTANGRIFLINPNGVLFGQGARVDAAGLVASTLDISNENFLSGNYNFFKNGLNSFVVNQGQITITNGGYAFLLSQGIDNQGSIKADLGKVVLASGEKMTLALDDLSEISVVVDEAVKNEVFGVSGEKVDSAVKNSGTITADGGKVTLTAKALNTVFDYAINNTGVIQANALVSNNGVIELLGEGAPIINIGKVAADGSIEAPSAGKVSIAGPEVLQQGQVTANAQEAGKAGEISIVSENQTTLGTGSSTEAKAQGSAGEGGKVFIDSTAGNTAVNSGAVIDVSAGSQAGNAGAVEISALKVLNFNGIINGWAPLGYLGGVAILDPTDATISGTLNANTTVWATNDITITNTVIINGSFTLNLFADHNSETAGDWEDGIGAILNPNDRRIEAADGTDTALNLKAGSGIGIDNPITTRKVHTLTAEINPDFGAGDINLVSDPADVSLRLAGIFTPSGNISIENRNNVAIIIDRLSPDPVFSFAIETDNGSVTIANVGPISIPGTNSDGILATGDITLITTDGNADITADADNTFAALWSIDGGITLDAGNNISLGEVSAVSVFADNGNISLIAGNDISIINGTLINAVLGNIELTAGNNIDLGLLEALGVVTLTAGGQVSDNNGVDNNIAANDLFVTGVLGIDLDTSINTLTAVSADSDITISEFDGLAVNTVDAGTGNVTLELASGAITDNNLEANNVSANGLSLSAPLGIDLDTQVATLTASTTDNDITIREADDVALNTVDAGTANVDLSSALGSISDNNLDATNITANNLTLTANSGVDLDTDVATLDAIAGSLTINEFDAITLNALDIFGGSINITADGTITTVDLLASDANGNIVLTANTGDILVDTLEAGNTVELNALLGGILDNNLGANNIISTNLIATAATGINLDTLVDTLSASTTDAPITIREADDVALNTVDAGIADVSLSSAVGAITDNNVGLNNVIANILTLDVATGVDLDTMITSLVATVNDIGNLSIDEADDIILTELLTIDGNIAVTAVGAITALDLLALDTNVDGIGRDISLSADTGDINVYSLAADNDIDLSAASGAIVDSNGIDNNIIANSLTLTANSGIDLDTTVNSLDVILTGMGDLFIDEANEITLTAIEVINGNINLNAAGTINALNLLAQDIDADAIGGNIFLTASLGDISLGTLSADYTVDLVSSQGAITDNNGATNNITANELILTANSGINLDSAVNFLNAQTATGDIDISNDTALLTIDDFSLGNLVGVTTDDGNVSIANTGSIDLPGTNGDGIYATGDITLTSSGGNITAGSADFITAAWSDNGNINLNAKDDIYLGEVNAADLFVANGLGAINLTTENGDIFVDNGTNINSNAGDITLTSGNDINLLETLQGGTLIISDNAGNITLDAVNNIDLGVLQTAGDVSLTASAGAITDNNGATTNVTANNLILTANSGADLDTTVNALDAMLTGNGDLVIDEFDTIDLTVLGGTTIDITAGNTITATDLLTLNGDIILTALAGGINIGAIEAGASIILSALEGAINETGLGDAEVDLTASVIDLFAKDEIGSIVDELDIETDADILSAESISSKDIVITEANDVSIDTITTGGDVYLASSTGSILDANDIATNITADGLTLTAADDVDLDTDVSILDAIIGDNLTIREANDVSLYAIDVLGGNVNISAGNVLTITDSLLTNGGNLILSAANGIMQEQLGDIDTTAGEGIGAGSYTANADSNNDYIGTYTLASGGSIYTQDIDGSGEVQITAADIELGSGSLIAAGDRDVTLLPSFDGITPLTIGLGNAAGDFTLNNDELDSILTSGTVIIGDDNSGNILVREVAPDPLSFSDLMLITGGNINDVAGQLGIAISRLRLEAVSGIGESSNPLNINVDSLNAHTDLGSIFIDEADDIGLEELTAPDSIQLNANGEINDDNADLVNINTLDLLLTAGNGIGDLADAIETEIETLEAYAANGGIFINEADDVALNLVNAEDDDIMLTATGSILDNDLGAAPDDFDILGANITLYVGGHIGSSGEEEEVDLDLDSLVSLTENSRPDAPTDLNSLSHILGTWSNNNLVDVSWTPAINPNYYTGSDNSIAGYSFVWDNAANTIPDEIQDIGDITSLDDILLGDSASNYLHIRSLNSSGNWSDPIHLGSFKIDTVAPVISASRNSGPNINGWHNSDVTVSFEGIDELSGIDIDSLTAPIIISSEGEGQSVIGTVTDLAGNFAQVSEDNINIDKTAPVISSGRNVGPNANGWNNSDITVSFDGSDGLSGVDSITGPILVSTEGQGQSAIGTITDLAGNSVSITEDNINIDKTAPVIVAIRDIAPNINGFNNSDVTVSFNGVDGLSGVAGVTAPILLGSEGLNQSASGTVTDLAGNSAQVTEDNINIDKTSPVISITSPLNGAVIANQGVLSFGVSDNLTPAPLTTGPASGTVFNTSGAQNIVITATDLAGNITQELLTFTITSDFLESQLANAAILNPFFFANPQTTGQFQVSSFDAVGPVFFYHPLTPVDMSAFEEMAIEEEVCDFIDGTLCVKSKDESSGAKDAKKEDKKKEKK